MVWRPAYVHDGEGLGRAEVRVEGQADDDQELAHLVLAGEPHPLVGLGVGRPHHAHRVGRVVDQELVEARERGVLAARPGRARRRVSWRVAPVGAAVTCRQRGRALVGSGRPHRGAQYARTVAGDQRDQIDLRVDPLRWFFVRDDYFDVLARLRAETRCTPCAPGFWAVTRYEDIRDLSRDPQPFCSGRGALVNDPLRGPAATPMSAPLHPAHGSARARRLPRTGQPALHASGAGRAWRESIRKTAVDACSTASRPASEIDFVAALAAPFPLTVIAELLGIDEADREDFRGWSDAAIESPDLPPDETMAAARRALGLHRRAHPVQA